MALPISNARNNVIGGADSGAGNVISGNAGNGVSIAADSEVYGTGLPVSFTDGSNPGLLSFGSVSATPI